MKSLKGIFSALVTPFNRDGQVDFTGLWDNISACNVSKMTGYLILGSTGEVVHLDEPEKIAVLELTRRAIPADRTMIVGTGLHSTKATIEFTQLAAEKGADYALVVTPHYFKASMTMPVLTNYYRDVADASPIPVLLYNVPQFTGITMSPELIALLSKHPNIVGIKDSSGDVRALSQVLSMVKPDFQVLTGSAPVLYPAICLGAQGAILAVANFAAELCVKIYQLSLNGERLAARDCQMQLLALSESIASRYGVGGIKFAMQALGLTGGTVRAPLVMPDTAAQKAIQHILENNGFEIV